MAAIAAPVATTVLLLALGAALLFAAARRRAHRGLLGKVTAPTPGPDTTLLVTGVPALH